MTTNMTVKMAELVKNATSNMSVLVTCDKLAIEEDVRRTKEIKSKIFWLIKKRSNLIGCAGLEHVVQDLTNQINALRSEV